MVLQGTACYEGVSALLQGGLRAVAAAWRMDPERVADAEARLSLVVGPPAIVGGAAVPAWGREPVDGGPWRSCCSERRCAPGGLGSWP